MITVIDILKNGGKLVVLNSEGVGVGEYALSDFNGMELSTLTFLFEDVQRRIIERGASLPPIEGHYSVNLEEALLNG